MNFDSFAGASSRQVSKPWFFACCVALVVLWFPTLFLIDVNTSQLIINTMTTIVTFLLVALLQNSQNRSDQAMHAKLDAVVQATAGVSNKLIDLEDRTQKEIKQTKDSVRKAHKKKAE